MNHDSILPKVIINFLHYKAGNSIEEATRLYNDNKGAFNIVFNIMGDKFVMILLENIGEKTKKSKSKGI